MQLEDFQLGRADSDLPMYQQLENRVVAAVASGELSPGDRLPSVRELAAHLGINAVTVSKAFRELSRRGIVGGRGRGGTIIKAAPTSAEPAPTPHNEAQEMAAPALVSGSRAFQYMLRAAQSAGVISLTKAYASPEAIGAGALRGTMDQLIARMGPEVFEYTGADGSAELRRRLAEYFANQGLLCNEADVLITNGAQHALDVIARVSLPQGSTLLMERPTYFGMLDLARALHLNPIGVSLEDDGIDVEELTQTLQRARARALYVMPNFHNPSGVTMSLLKRQRIIELCAHHGLLVIEDDYAPELRFTGNRLPSLYELARGTEAQPFVCHIRSFNKSLLPGVRLGALIVPAPLREMCIAARGLSDLHSSNLVQAFALEYFQHVDVAAVKKQLTSHYAARLDTFTHALRAHLPSDVVFSKPEGGLNVWLRLPPRIEAGSLFYAAMVNRVSYLPGELFYPDRPDHQTLRLSFGSGSAEELEQGAMRLAAAMHSLSRRSGGGASVAV